jgi:predicted transcriptional regulator
MAKNESKIVYAFIGAPNQIAQELGADCACVYGLIYSYVQAGKECFFGNAEIAKYIHISVPTASRIIKKLKEHGWITTFEEKHKLKTKRYLLLTDKIPYSIIKESIQDSVTEKSVKKKIDKSRLFI